MKNNRLVRLPRLSVLGALCAVILAATTASSALAQDWRFEPIFRVGGEYDDNSTLDPRTDREVDLSGLLLAASANINYTSQAATFLLQPTVVSRNYNDDSVDDSDDFFLRSNFRRRTPKSTVGFRINFDQQSVRTGERADADLDIEDPDEIPDDDTGRTFRLGDRTKIRLSPNWRYQLSSVSSIGASLAYFDTRYDDVFNGLLRDYSDTRLSLDYRQSFSNVTDWEIILTGRSYDAEGSPENIDGYGVMAGIEHALSEKTRVRFRLGLEDNDGANVDSDPETVADVTLTRNLQTIRLLAQYRRTVSGSGAGRVSVRDSLNLNFRRRLNEKISAGLGVRAYQTKRPGGGGLDEDRDYVQLRSNLIWYLTSSFVIEVDYRYTVQDRGDLGERANSNRVNVWFTYQPRTIPGL